MYLIHKKSSNVRVTEVAGCTYTHQIVEWLEGYESFDTVNVSRKTVKTVDDIQNYFSVKLQIQI